MKRAAMMMLCLGMVLLLGGTADARNKCRQPCYIPQQCCPAPPHGGSGEVCHSTTPCWCLQFPIVDDEAGYTYYFAYANAAQCLDPLDHYAWYPTGYAAPQVCDPSAACECLPDAGQAKLDRDTTLARVLLAKQGTAPVRTANLTESGNFVLTSALFPPPTPFRIAIKNHTLKLHQLRQRQWWRIPRSNQQWIPADGIATNDAKTKWVWVRPTGGGANIPVKIQFGHMNFLNTTNPHYPVGQDAEAFSIGVQVDRFPNGSQTIGPLDPANIPLANPYSGTVTLPAPDNRTVRILTHDPLR